MRAGDENQGIVIRLFEIVGKFTLDLVRRNVNLGIIRRVLRGIEAALGTIIRRVGAKVNAPEHLYETVAALKNPLGALAWHISVSFFTKHRTEQLKKGLSRDICFHIFSIWYIITSGLTRLCSENLNTLISVESLLTETDFAPGKMGCLQVSSHIRFSRQIRAAFGGQVSETHGSNHEPI